MVLANYVVVAAAAVDGDDVSDAVADAVLPNELGLSELYK
jgi:isocitrate dehydrogenase